MAFCRYIRTMRPRQIRIAIVLDNFSPHLSTKKDTRVSDWARANNVELAYSPHYAPTRERWPLTTARRPITMFSIAFGRGDVIVGVDTHKNEHVAVAIDGSRLSARRSQLDGQPGRIRRPGDPRPSSLGPCPSSGRRAWGLMAAGWHVTCAATGAGTFSPISVCSDS